MVHAGFDNGQRSVEHGFGVHRHGIAQELRQLLVNRVVAGPELRMVDVEAPKACVVLRVRVQKSAMIS